jgi:HK97 family phage major capsid protein
MDLNELLRERTKIIAAMRQLTDKVSAEKREFTAEEDAKWSRMNEDLDQLDKKIEREKRVQGLEAESRAITNPTSMPTPGISNGSNPRATDEYRASYRRLLLDGPTALTPMERRALQADNATQAGFWVAPQQFSQELIQAVDDLVFIRNLANKIRVANAASLGIPTIETDLADTEWTKEIATGSEDSSLAAGKRELYPHPLAKRIKVSQKLLRMSTQPVDQIVRQRLSYKFALVQEKAFLTGPGAEQPLGVFTASPNGISTSRDVSTGNTATAIGADGLIEAKYSLKSQYQASSSLRWIFHRTAVKNIRKLKDGDGQYLWRPGLAGDSGDRILDIAFLMSEWAPSTFTTGLYVGIIGDFRFYYIVDALDVTIQVLTELYAETNQVGYIGRCEVDGMPVLEEAFTRVKLA